MKKHAYLIMAHHRPDILKLLIDAIDDERNDIYLHIDLKSKKLPWNISTQKAGLILAESMSVNWGGYTQVECEYRLLKLAVEKETYEYYHLLTGATYPLKSQDEIHRYFDKNAGFEFVGFDNKNSYLNRVKYNHLFCEDGKPSGLSGKIKIEMRKIFISLQKRVGVDRFARFNMECKKGMAYWSITHELVCYLIDNETLVHAMLKNSVSGDEVFVQTITYNSHFRLKLYCEDDEFTGASREFAWENFGDRPGHNFVLDDLNDLLNSNKCFALKFDGEDGLNLIRVIRKNKIYEIG